ncbi:MAG: hypothetical protein WC154_00185 [Candidatus Izemoplasmatales bacterium]
MYKDQYDDYEDIKRFYKSKTQYQELLNDLDYYYSLFENMNFFVNNFYIVINSFKSVKTFDKFTEDNILEIFNDYLENTKTTTHLDLGHMLYNSRNTLYSIRNCVEVLNVSDAMTLFRKFKDDLLLFVYFLKLSKASEEEYNTEEKLEKYNAHVKNAFDWSNNKLSDFYSHNAIKYLKKDNKIKKLSKSTSILSDLFKLNEGLNNFAHSNGISYITKYNPVHEVKQMMIFLGYMKRELNKVIATILTITFYLSPGYLASTDYVDYLDAGLTPPKGTQYIVASYLQDYIDNKIFKVNPKLKEFLVNNSCMNIK